MPRRALWLITLCAALVLCAATAQPPRDRRLGHQTPLLPRPELVRTLGKPFLHLITDYYWILTVNQVGRATTAEEYRDTYYWAQMVAALDPKFRQVYLFAGTAIPVNLGGGKWANGDEAIRILQLGAERFPNEVFLRLVLAYNLSQVRGDYAGAGRVLEEAAKLPGAPPYAQSLATRMYARAGDFETAEAFTMALAQDSEDPETRAAFQQRVLELRLERELQRVDAAVRTFREREGRIPRELQELLAAGLLERAPEDPLGGQIILDAQGRARSTAQERRLSELGDSQVKVKP